MTDLELLTETLDRLNVYYSTRVNSDGKLVVTLEDDPTFSGEKVNYCGYQGFAYLFFFEDGKLLEVGGYE
jgi:hypothetical protein